MHLLRCFNVLFAIKSKPVVAIHSFPSKPVVAIHSFPSKKKKKLETREAVYYLKRLFGVSFCVIIMKGLLGRANTNVQHDVISQNTCFTCACKIKQN